MARQPEYITVEYADYQQPVLPYEADTTSDRMPFVSRLISTGVISALLISGGAATRFYIDDGKNPTAVIENPTKYLAVYKQVVEWGLDGLAALTPESSESNTGEDTPKQAQLAPTDISDLPYVEIQEQDRTQEGEKDA